MRIINNGTSMTEYVIPTVTVGLALGVGMYVFGSSDILLNLFLSSTGGKLDLQKRAIVLGNPVSNVNPAFNIVKSGVLGGTVVKPVEQCGGGVCVIDYGSFVIKGVPQNFNKFIETTGVSSAKTKMANIIEQVADQSKEPGATICNPGVSPEQCSKELAKLSNLMHFDAKLSGYIEQVIRESVDRRTFKHMFLNKKLRELDINISDQYTGLIPAFDINKRLFDVYARTNFGEVRRMKVLFRHEYDNKIDKELPYAVVEQFDKIQESSIYRPAVKQLARKIYLDMADISYNMGIIYESKVLPHNKLVNYTYIDPLTGEISKEITREVNDDLNEIINPDLSRVVDEQAGVICDITIHEDDGTYCGE